MRHHRVVEGHARHPRSAIHIVAVRSGVIAFERVRHVECGGVHAQRRKDHLLHCLVVGRAQLALGIVEMRTHVTRGGRHQVAVLKHFAEAAGGLHRAEQRHGGFRSRVFELEEPFQILARQSGACAHQVLHQNLARGRGIAQFELRIDFGDRLVPAQLLLIHKPREQKRRWMDKIE